MSGGLSTISEMSNENMVEQGTNDKKANLKQKKPRCKLPKKQFSEELGPSLSDLNISSFEFPNLNPLLRSLTQPKNEKQNLEQDGKPQIHESLKFEMPNPPKFDKNLKIEALKNGIHEFDQVKTIAIERIGHLPMLEAPGSGQRNSVLATSKNDDLTEEVQDLNESVIMYTDDEFVDDLTDSWYKTARSVFRRGGSRNCFLYHKLKQIEKQLS